MTVNVVMWLGFYDKFMSNWQEIVVDGASGWVFKDCRQYFSEMWTYKAQIIENFNIFCSTNKNS